MNKRKGIKQTKEQVPSSLINMKDLERNIQKELQKSNEEKN